MKNSRVWMLAVFGGLASLAFFAGNSDAKPETVIKITDGVWFREGDLKNLGHCNNIIIEMKDYLIVVDANFPSGAKAQFDLFPEDARAFRRVAKKAGLKVSPRRSAFLVEGKDRVGAVARILEKLGDAKVNVTATDAIATGGRFGTIVWVRRDNVNRAARVLRAKR